jgi:hypothetical protein
MDRGVQEVQHAIIRKTVAVFNWYTTNRILFWPSNSCHEPLNFLDRFDDQLTLRM